MITPKIVCLEVSRFGRELAFWNELRCLGELDLHDTRPESREGLMTALEGATVLVGDDMGIDDAMLARLPNLKMISMWGTGYDDTDVIAAAKRGITVCNAPGYGTEAVAQFTVAMILQLACRVTECERLTRESGWKAVRPQVIAGFQAVELAGLTAGLVGFGRIGRRVAELLRAFGMNLLIHAPTACERIAEFGAEAVDLPELFERSDLVSLHCRANEANRGLVNRTLLDRMKPTAWLINTARGSLVNEADLVVALKRGQIGAAALDAVDPEPLDPSSELLALPNCHITPHIAWNSGRSRERLLEITLENVRAYLRGEPVNVVNRR